MKRRTPLLLVLILGLTTASTPAQDREPNDDPAQAIAISLNTPVTGTRHFGDQSDFYRLRLPAAGIVTVELSGYPADCGFQIAVQGFQKSTTESAGSADGKPGEPMRVRFAARGGHDGFIRVSLKTIDKTSSTKDFGCVRCVPGGPWHLTPWKDKPTGNVPATHEGAKLLPPIQYQLTVTHQPLPDAYEHTEVTGLKYPELLSRGAIKTIPAGKQISAYLFDEQPRLLRDESLGLDSDGGENDVDVYHVRLAEPDTVRVAVVDLPEGINSRIRVFHPYGWEDSKPGQAHVEAKVPKAGDLFVEIARGDGPDPLAFSTTPYRLMVTTASGGGIVGGDPTGNPTGPGGKPRMTLGDSVAVGGGTVGPGGGDVVIRKPGDPLDGLKITVPDGAYPGGCDFKVSHRPIDKHDLGPLFNAVSPLITIENGGQYADKLMQVKIPADVPAGHFAMPYYYDEKTGEIEAIPMVAADRDSVTALTRHFSNLGATSAEPKAFLSKNVETGFLPGKDDWQFPNESSYINKPGGICAGMAASAYYYYYQTGGKDASKRLYGLYDNNDREAATPGFWLDDSLGYCCAAVLQTETKWDHWLFELQYNLGETAQELTWYSFAYALALTGQPQHVGLYSRQTGGGHAVIAYRIAGDTIYVADPNWAGDTGAARQIRFDGKKFLPYSTATNPKTDPDPLDMVMLCAKTAILPWDTIGRRWAQVHDRSILKEKFPQYRILCRAPDSQQMVELTDNYTTDRPSIEIDVSPPPGNFSPHLRIYDDRTGQEHELSSMKDSITIPLQPGINRLGFYTYFKVRDQGQIVEAWCGFRWLSVNHFTMTVDPATQTIDAKKEAKFTAYCAKASRVINPRYEWQFGDNTPYETAETPDMKHPYETAGTYTVIARLYENVTNELIADGRATVMVRPSTTTPPPVSPGGVLVQITHNIGSLATTTIRPRNDNQPRPAGPPRTLTGLTGGTRGQQYTFTANVTGLTEGAQVSYKWTAAGQSKTTETNRAQFAFSTIAEHPVSVTVVDKATGKQLGRGQTTASIAE